MRTHQDDKRATSTLYSHNASFLGLYCGLSSQMQHGSTEDDCQFVLSLIVLNSPCSFPNVDCVAFTLYGKITEKVLSTQGIQNSAPVRLFAGLGMVSLGCIQLQL